MAREPMETIRAVLAIMVVASQAGLEPQPLLGAVGLSIAQIQDMEGRVPARTVMALWDEAVRLTGREYLGLSVGQWYPRDPGDVVSEIFFHSVNLGEGMTTAISYYTLVSEGHYPVEEEIEGKRRVKLITDPSLPQIHKPTAEAILSVVAKMFLSFTGGKEIFEEVTFKHGHSGDTGPYLEHFKAPVRFDQDCNALVLKPGARKMANAKTNPAILEILKRYATDRAASLQPATQFLEDVRAITAQLLRGEGFFSREIVARKLGVGQRTLQRRLNESGTTFQGLLETVRREVSVACLENPKFTIMDTAFMTGYGSQGTFSRAFVRWFGVPPAQYRRGRTASNGG